MDAPASRHSPDDQAWNFRIAVSENAIFWFSYSFLSPFTIMALFVSSLTPSALAVAAVSALNLVAWALPQLMALRWAARFSTRMRFLLPVGMVGRLGLGLLVVATYLLSVRLPVLMLALVYLLFGVFRATSGTMAPVWWTLIADTIPAHRRGRFYGIALFAGTGLGVLGTLVAGRLLGRYPFPLNFAVCFAVATLTAAASLYLFSFTREPLDAQDWRRSTPSSANVRGLLQVYPVLRRFLVARSFIGLGMMATSFYSVYAFQALGGSEAEVATKGSYWLLAQSVVSLLAGWLGDRYGHKATIEVGALSQVAAALVAMAAPSPEWVSLIFILSGIAWACLTVADQIFVLEFVGDAHKGMGVAILNTMLAPISAAAPLLGGMLVEFSSYASMFMAAAILSAAGWSLVHFRVPDPRAQMAGTPAARDGGGGNNCAADGK